MQEKLTLVTYNIRTSMFNEVEHSDELNNWKYRKQAVFDLIRKQDADIVCFQEDTKEQLDDLTEEFSDMYQAVFFDEALSEDNPEYNAVFVKKEIAVNDKKYFFVSDTPMEASRIEGSLWTRHFNSFNCVFNDTQYAVINVHLDNSEDYEFKKKEAEVFLSIFDANFSNEKNVIISGDFNMRADDNDAYKLFATRLTDISKVFGVREPTHPNWMMYNIYKQIDYVWMLPETNLHPVSFEIIKDKYIRQDGKYIEPSDHFLIKSEFSFL